MSSFFSISIQYDFGYYNVFCNFCRQILFVVDQCNKSISKSWDSRDCWNNWQVHIFKIINNKKNMINNIFYLTKYHLHSFFLFKNSMIGMVKNMILYKKYQKYMQNSFQRRIYLQTIWRQYQSSNALNGILRNRFVNHFKVDSSFTWKYNNTSFS